MEHRRSRRRRPLFRGGRSKFSSSRLWVSSAVLCLVLVAMAAAQNTDEGMSSELADALGLGSDVGADLETTGGGAEAGTVPATPDENSTSSTSAPAAGAEGEKDGDVVVDVLGPDGGGGPFVDPIFARKSRTWNAIVTPAALQEILRSDRNQRPGALILTERDAFKFTEVPSAAPSSYPTSAPSSAPTSEPSSFPTSAPSSNPTSAPSSEPTATPTFSPTENIWVTEPEPRSYRSSYFNYDPYSRRGPGDWDRVDDAEESEYWREFQQYIAPSLNTNRCESNSDRQSPIDVRFEWAKGQCFEYHMIRSKPGEYSIEEPIVKKQILPSKLRAVYPRNINPYASWATENDAVKGPSADMPKGWGHQLPVTHLDIKVPSEHWMEGKQYPAEYQIYIIQNRESQRGGPAISILLDLHPENKHNNRFQIVLDAFQEEWDYDLARCEDRMRKQRRLRAMFDFFGAGSKFDKFGEGISTWLDEPEEEEIKFQKHLRNVERKAQGYRKFNPFSEDLMTTDWFFGYEGSLTEPPCTEFIEWRVMDKPGLISKEQLFQLKKLLFWHVDKNCDRTSVHYEGSVARPPQPYRGRWVHRCMCRDFLSDKDRDWYGENRCLWKERDQFGFDRDIYTLEWYDEHHKYETPADQPKGTWQS